MNNSIHRIRNSERLFNIFIRNSEGLFNIFIRNSEGVFTIISRVLFKTHQNKRKKTSFPFLINPRYLATS